MATIRVGFGSDFKVSDSKIGIGTANPTALLEVSETAKADFNITGVTTLTSYGGFIAQNQYVNKPSAIGFATIGVGTLTQYYETETGFTDLGGVHHGDDQRFNTLSEDLIIDDGQILNITNTDMVGVTTIGEYDPHSHSSYVCAGSLEQVSVTGHFSVPNGGSNDRKDNPIEGTVRFNTDLNTIEFYNGIEWKQFTYNQGQSGRAVSAGGEASSNITTMEYVRIPTTGNGINFGDLQEARFAIGRGSSSTRGLFAGGDPGPSTSNRIEYLTIASEGNAIDFGVLTAAGRCFSGTSSSTRALFGGVNASNTVNYVEIATLGDGISFGDLNNTGNKGYAVSSPTRAVFNGGGTYQRMDMMTIASKGNATVFGEIGSNSVQKTGLSNSVRGIFAGGYKGESPYYTETAMVYINIASAGNSQNFGDLVQQSSKFGGVSTQTRGLFICGNHVNVGSLNTMQYVTISTQGDAIDFGDAAVAASNRGNLSDSHGGLGGF
jgi:hypothetical protein